MKNIHVLATGKPSSVEWLDRWFRDNPEATYEEGNAALQQAQAMHKQDNEKTWIASAEYAILVLKDKTSKSSKEAFEQYYQQTYGDD